MFKNCTTLDCGNPVFALGKCRKHYEKDRLAQAGPCSFLGCQSTKYRGVFCVKHYKENLEKNKPNCSVPGCANKQLCNGLCAKHNSRLSKHGSVDSRRAADWGARETHPLYNRWAYFRRLNLLSSNWALDFWLFAEEVGIPPTGCTLRRKNKELPFSSDNWYWKEADVGLTGAERARKLRNSNPERAKHYLLKRYYGLTYEEYEKMLVQQDSRCGICGGPETTKHRDGGPRSMPVDHCHKSGKVRMLLCTQCNRGLGMFKESPDVLRKAAEYIERFSKD